MNWNQLLLRQIPLNLLVTLVLVQPATATTLLQELFDKQPNSPETLVFQQRPTRGAPGNRGDTTGRDPFNFLVMAPVANLGLTIAAHPIVWLYLPHPLPTSTPFKLRLQDAERTVIYETTLTLDQAEGFVPIAFPATELPLEVGKKYNWHLSYDRTKRHGWIERVVPSPELASQLVEVTRRERILLLAQQGIWFDTFHELIALRRDLNTQLAQTSHEDRPALFAEYGLWQEALAECLQPEQTTAISLDEDWRALLTHPTVRLDGLVALS